MHFKALQKVWLIKSHITLKHYRFEVKKDLAILLYDRFTELIASVEESEGLFCVILKRRF